MRKGTMVAFVAALGAAVMVLIWSAARPAADAAGRDEERETFSSVDSGEEFLSEPEADGVDEDPADEATADVDDEAEDRDGADAASAESAEDLAVDEFDALTDRWEEPSSGEVTMKDIEKFGATFRKIPKERQDECAQRALNLIPDENVMLLAGILMDKSLDKGIIESVFNDVLNRDEEVKMPILEQIFKDREHPCWADVAWILDVTGEVPGEK